MVVLGRGGGVTVRCIVCLLYGCLFSWSIFFRWGYVGISLGGLCAGAERFVRVGGVFVVPGGERCTATVY